MKATNYMLALSLGLLIASCGENTNKTPSGSGTNLTTDLKTDEMVTPTGEVVEIVLKSEDNMKFDQSELKVKEGQTVKLTLVHTGTMPKSAMGHNFVLLKKGVDLTAFGNACAKAKAPDYDIPYDLMKDVIAHTKMIGGGESDTTEFLTPAKGTYQFLCSFPGHYGMMKGLFIVD